LDLALANRLPVRPGGKLLDLARELVEIVSNEIDEQPGDRGIDLDSERRELPPDPARQIGSGATLRQVVGEQLAGLRYRLAQRRVLLDPLPDQGQDGLGRGGFQVVDDGLRLGRLPALDVLDDDEPSFAGEETEGVAGSHDLLPTGLEGGQGLGRVLADSVTEP